MISKFRAWYKKNTLPMLGVSLISFDQNFIDAYIDKELKAETEMSFDLDDVILMQSTGLFDVNGQEIFEGDVVELHHFTEYYDITGGFYEGEEISVGVIRYGYTDIEIKGIGKVYPPRWLLKTGYEELSFSHLSGVHEESFEIIGNIYENPELVEVEK
ncbi:TPA: YopX family protein [Streptococcus suis]